ncbi:hypothetical protein BBJ28_00005961 [Nothophytophthora sp. Chile5]|nr:hypothetical protein BBJ28_00005961 [Nothophytophthora sp. Chile5]
MVQATYRMRVREKKANAAAPSVSTTQGAESNGNESAKASLEETSAREQQNQAEKTRPTPPVTANGSTLSASETSQSLPGSASQPKKAPYQFHSAPVSPATRNFANKGSERGSEGFQGHSAPRSAEAGFEAAARAAQEEAQNRDLVVRGRNAQQSAGSSDAMVAHQPMARGGGGFIPSMPSTGGGDDDGLRAVWISDYDHINARIMELEAQIVRKTEEGHAFVHRFGNITIPDDLKLQISQLRAQLDTALGIRFKSVIRVLIFSTAVRAFAQQNEHANIWSDVPEVLNASHRKCAALASEISDLERSAQGFRRAIDTAVSSGQMQNVPQLGALLKDVEGKIQGTNAERGKQFSFMFQFSEALRRMVVAEWGGASPGEDYAQPRLQR